MRIRSLLCLLALFAFVCTAPVLAEETTDFRFYDDQGTLLNNVNVSFLDHTAATSEKVPPQSSGVYTLAVAPGSKIEFQVSGPDQDYASTSVLVPVDLAGPMDVILVSSFSAHGDCNLAETINPGDTVSGNTSVDGQFPGAAPFCVTSVSALGVWYTTTGTGGTFTASTCNQAAYDTKINVYCNDCDDFVCVTGNDDGPGCAAFSSEISWCSELDPVTGEGLEYLILIQGFAGATGAFDLTLTDAGDSCNLGNQQSCAPPEPQGACCNCLNSPFNCTAGGLSACLELGGDFQGDGSTCLVVQNSSAPGLAIPDNGFPNFVVDEIDLAGLPLITDVNVGLQLNHTWIGDIISIVEHPNTNQSGLWNFNCGGPSFQGIDTEFDDEGTAQFCNPGGPTPAPNDGNGNIVALGGPDLSQFDGTSPDGTWRLLTADNFPADIGTVELWYLRFNDLGFAELCIEQPPDDDDDSFFTTLCHCPPGLGGQGCHTITVGGFAADAHLGNHSFDSVGECTNSSALQHDLVGEGQQGGGTVGFGMDSNSNSNSDDGNDQPATSLRRRLR
jgi:subtilisin-like proprotein convertase family protein